MLGAVPATPPSAERLSLRMGPTGQTLTFVRGDAAGAGAHADLRPPADADADADDAAGATMEVVCAPARPATA